MIRSPKALAAMADGLSADASVAGAAHQVCDQIEAGLGERRGGTRPDVVVFAASGGGANGHAAHLASIERIITQRLAPNHVMGISAQGVIGGSVEVEETPAIAGMGASWPGVSFTPFSSADLPASLAESELEDGATVGGATADELQRVSEVTGIGAAGAGHRATIVLADPFTTPIGSLLRSLSQSRRVAGATGPIAGGLASAANRPGGNTLLIDGRITSTGCVGLTIAGGNLRVDGVVSQGCTPIGGNYIVTAAQGQFIKSLGGRPALAVLQELVEQLSEEERQKLSGGLHVGRVVDEYKDRFGRSDYLMRNVVGVMQSEKAIAVADRVRVGQTVRFHMRDAQTADQDLGLLLDAQALHDRPMGVMLFTCNGRGTGLFGTPHHDATAVQRAFHDPTPAETKAKAGAPVAVEKHVPLMGFFAAGEIGPVGSEVFLHGQTASMLVFRES